MDEKVRPPIWQMVKEAVEYFGGSATYRDIRNYVQEKYHNVKRNSIDAQIIVLTVNHPSRIHYLENSKPRVSNSKYDILFRTEKGKVELYDPSKHGIWEIRKSEDGRLYVARQDDEINNLEEIPESDDERYHFALESHLRDFIASNIETIKIHNSKLTLFIDDNNNAGIEYPTDVGNIDILAVDDDGNFVVFELKLLKGIDAALGQLLRYMGWVKTHLANDNNVFGVIVAKNVNEKLKYAAKMVPNIMVFEYELKFSLHKVDM